MTSEKPTPTLSERGKKICPVCGKPSYSREGIHPQCAIEQADAPRQKELVEQKKKDGKEKKKPVRKSWNKKCPKCSAEVHVRKATCDCGHSFYSKK